MGKGMCYLASCEVSRRVRTYLFCVPVILVILFYMRSDVKSYVDLPLRVDFQPPEARAAFSDFGNNTIESQVFTDIESKLKKYIEFMNTKILDPDAQLIVKSVIEAHFLEFPTSPAFPSCKGDRLPNEVEDILCIPRPKFLKEVKNPCWWDDEPGKERVLRCLPYFHILGFGKCGSTDLWRRITEHPHIFRIDGTMHKEANWWAWGRYGYYSYKFRPIRNFTQYTESFRILTSKVRESLSAGDERHKMYITGDASPNEISDFRGWPNITQNRGLKLPSVLTPHLMQHFYPNPRFIVLFRNPVDKMFSEYFFINGTRSKSVEEFHTFFLKSVKIMAKCIRERSLRECFFDRHVFSALPLRIHFMFYSVYIPVWLKLFPRDRFLFIKTEDYGKNISRTVKACLDFIDVESLSPTQMDRIAGEKRELVNPRKSKKRVMLPETRKIMEEMARPAMHLLADILQDDKFRMD